MLALNTIQSLVLLPPRPECWDMVCMFYYAWFIQCWALELQVYQTRTLPTSPLPNPDTSFYKMHLQCFFIQEALPEGPQKKIVSCVEEHLSHWAPQFLEPASARPVALP